MPKKLAQPNSLEKVRMPESESKASKQVSMGRNSHRWDSAHIRSKPATEIPHPVTDGHSHCWTNFADELWICKTCTLIVWMPTSFDEARGFSYDIDRLGFKKAYEKALDSRPEIKKALKKLNAAMDLMRHDLAHASSAPSSELPIHSTDPVSSLRPD